jgi:hypothetical protein
VGPYISSTLLMCVKDVPRAVTEIVTGIATKKPVYIVVQREFADVPGNAEIMAIVNRDYVFEQKIGYAYLFRRRPGI